MDKYQEKPLKNRVVGAVAASLVGLTLSAQVPVQRPSLVVGVMIDGLSMDYLNLLQGYMVEGGFKRLIQDGITILDLDYGTPVDMPTATAIAYTGAVPAVNGVSASTVYDAALRLIRPVFFDPATMGNYTDETVSPAALRVSTISDELRIAGGGLGSVYSISPDQATSLIMGGHAGNNAAWINDVTGNWASTAFYQEMPVLLQTKNRMQPLSVRLDTISWAPLLPIDQYPDIPSYKKAYPMRNTFLRKDINRYKAFKASAPVNTEVTSVATEYITSFKLGQHDETDMLNLAYTVQPYDYSVDADARIEQMDIYLRLDRELERLFSAIDGGPGMNRTLVFVAGTPRKTRTRRDDEKWAIPHGEFSPRRAMSLLNVYIIALHGNGEWVNGFHDKQIYLNHTLAKERGVDMEKLRADVASFMTRMSGVVDAYSIDDIINLKAGVNPQATRNNTVIDNAGDVFITVAPGWQIVDSGSDLEIPLVERSGTTTAPGFILAPTLKAEIIESPVDARIMASTIARCLRIRAPNGASVPSLKL